MRVLLIDVNCKNSSTGKIVYDLYSEMNNGGDSSAVCYGRGPLITSPNIYKFGIDWETTMHAVLTRLTGYTGCFSFFSTRRLIKFIKMFRPDVIHIHELHAYFVNIKPLLKYLISLNIPIVWTFHCEFMYTGKCGYAYDCQGFLSGCGNCPQLRDYPKSIIFDRTKYMFKQKKELFDEINRITIITPSKWLADRVKSSFLYEKTVSVIHNGIDTSIFYPRRVDVVRRKFNIKEGENVIVSIAPNIMDERKGGKWVLELAESMKGEDIRFILVGVSDILIPHPENTILLPRTNKQDELAVLYSLADVFVICSSRENFPTTCIEALCCGTPVCGFDTGGTKETATEPYGCFVKYGDIDQLNAGIKKFLAIPDRKEFKKKCSDYNIQRYAKRKMVNSYIETYYQVR